MRKGFGTTLPVWTLAGAALAFAYPPLFQWTLYAAPVALALAAAVFGMTFSRADLRHLSAHLHELYYGLVLQCALPPCVAWFAADLFGLGPLQRVGLFLAACSTGAPIANVVAYLAHADLALSIALSVLANVLTLCLAPWLVSILAGAQIGRLDWSALGAFAATVVAPVLCGAVFRRSRPAAALRLVAAGPYVAGAAVVLAIIPAALRIPREPGSVDGPLVQAVLFLELASMALAFALSRVTTGDSRAARTIAIQTGMVNSGLGFMLARNILGAGRLTTPTHVGAACQIAVGAVAVAFWRYYRRARALPAVRSAGVPL